jgi:Tfp pilus assembly protein PilF
MALKPNFNPVLGGKLMFKRTALTLMLAVSTIAIAAPAIAKEAKAAAAPTGKPSKGMMKAAVEIQKLATAKDWAGLKAQLTAAETIPDRNSFDNYFISQYRYNAGLELKDDALAMAGLDGMVASEFVPADQKPKILRNLIAMSDKSKDYTKARAYADRYLQLVPDDANIQVYVAEQMLKAKDFAGADAKFMQMIKAGEAAGKPAEEYVYLKMVIGREQSKAANFSEGLQMLVSQYPTGRNWTFLLENFQTRTSMIGRQAIDLFRLMNVAGALKSAGSVTDAAQTALDAGVPGDAKAFLAKAEAAGLMTDRKSEAATLNKLASASLAADEPAAKQEAAATTGDRLASVGQLYLSLGNYAKANDVFAKALAKGVRNKNETLIRAGISKLMGGDAAGAKTSWASVAGDAKLAELAKYWALYADKRSQ